MAPLLFGSLVLAQAPLMLPSPWNWIGLVGAVVIVLVIFASVLGVILKFGKRPQHKPAQMPAGYTRNPQPSATLPPLLPSGEESEPARLLAAKPEDLS